MVLSVRETGQDVFAASGIVRQFSVIFEPGYTLPTDDQPLSHARIAHSGTWIDGTPTATSTAAGFFADAPNNSLTYEYWSPSTLPGTWTLTPTEAQTVDYCCIGAHTLGTTGATLTVEYESAPTVWTAIIDNTTVINDSPLFIIFRPVTGTGFRVTVDGSTVPRIGVIRFGTAMQMQQPIYGGQRPLIFSRQTVMRSNKSTTGEFLGRTRLRNARSTTLNWTHLEADWVNENWHPFQFALEEDPFFIAWRPSSYPQDVGYCYVDGEESPTPSNMGIRDLMEVSMDVIARGYD